MLALFVGGCAHSQAAPSAPSMEEVIQAVHDYGRGHQSSVLPPPSSIPQETEPHYSAHVTELLLSSDFAQLEKIAQQNREDRGLLFGGAWKNNVFYNALSAPPTDMGNPTGGDYEKQIARLNAWLAAYPDSATAHIVFARLYTNYAFLARGNGPADSVSDSQWQIYKQRNILAEQHLLTAARLKDRDPHWYEAVQEVAFQVGWEKSDALDLLNNAVAFEPSYYHYYREYADYLKPQWYGDPGEIAQFAEQTSLQLKDPDASILYFRITSTLACNCEPQIADLPGLDWPKFKSGYSYVSRLYGVSNINANRIAWMAFKFSDKATAQQAFSLLDHMEMDVWWGPHTFANARDWANTP